MKNQKFSALRVLKALRVLLVAIVVFLMIMFMGIGASNDSLDVSIRMMLMSALVLMYIIFMVFFGGLNTISAFVLLFLVGFFTVLNAGSLVLEPFDAVVWTYMSLWLICYIVACVNIVHYYRQKK